MLEQYPAALAYLYTPANSAWTTLSSAIDDDDTTITVASTADFPATGIVSINDEIILYSSKDATHFYVYAGTGGHDGRGHDSTVAASHDSSSRVERRITAADQSAIQDALTNAQYIAGFYDPVELTVGQLVAADVGLPYAFDINYHRAAHIRYMIERVSDYGSGDERIFEFGSMWMIYAEGITTTTQVVIPESNISVNTLGDSTVAGVVFSCRKDSDVIRLQYTSTDIGGADPENIYFQGVITLYGTGGASIVDGDLPTT